MTELLVVIAILAAMFIFVPSWAATQKRPNDVAALHCGKTIAGGEISDGGDHNSSFAGNVPALRTADITEECPGIQLHHFDDLQETL